MFTMIFVKLLIGFFGLWIITFVIGRKEIGQVTPFDFFTTILLSEIVGNTLYDQEVNYYHLIFALSLWAILSYSMDKLSVRYMKIKRLTEGRAILLIDKGQVNQKLLHSCKLDFNQLITMLREKNIFDLDEVAYALYETNGTISVIKKPEYESARAPSIPVIERGVVQCDAVLGKKINEDKIRKLAKNQGYPDIEDIAYAEYREEKDELLIVKKENHS